MSSSEPERIEIGATVKRYWKDQGPYIVIGEIFWGMRSCRQPPVRKLFLYDPVAEKTVYGEWSETSIYKVETTQ